MTKNTVVLILCGIISFGLYAQTGVPEKPLKVRAIYPTGTQVSTAAQITIEFNQNIVALGASMFVDDVVPVEIEPELDCEWNWVKLDTLKCELQDDSLRPSTRYQVTVKPGVQNFRGQTMEQEYVHEFDTRTPTIWSASLVSWMSPTQPVFELSLSQEVERKELLGKVFLHDEVSGRDIPTSVKHYGYYSSRMLEEDFFGSSKKYRRLNDFLKARSIYVLPKETLSYSAKVSVVLAPGVTGAGGNLSSTERLIKDTYVSTFDEEFRLLGLECQDVFNQPVFLEVDRTHDALCDITSSFALVFSSALEHSTLTDVVQFQPSIENSSVQRGNPRVPSSRYKVRANFEPNTTYRVSIGQTNPDGELSSQAIVRDGFGRALAGTNQLTFKTDRASPRLFVDQSPLVIDSKGMYDPLLYLRNIEDVNVRYDLADAHGELRDQILIKSPPDRDDVIQPQGLGLRSVLRSESGVMFGTIVGRPRFDHRIEQLERTIFAQATPYSVFLKLGAANSLAWVVDFQTGEPVPAAEVEFYQSTATEFSTVQTPIWTGVTDADGLALLPGFEVIDPHWDQVDHSMAQECDDERECTAYFLRVQSNDELATLPLVDHYQLRGSSRVDFYADLDHWATTPQKLYQPGDVVHIKGFVRQEYHEQRTIPSKGVFALCVQGPKERTYEIGGITLNEFGAYHASFKLNNRTPLGDYDIVLAYDPELAMTDPCSTRHYWDDDSSVNRLIKGGQFEVFEFKTNPIRVHQEFDADRYERDDPLIITTTAELHAGGPYANATGNIYIEVRSSNPSIEHEAAKDYEFASGRYGGRDRWRQQVALDALELNSQGISEYTIDSLDIDFYYGKLTVESAVVSDRGKFVATHSSAPYFGVDQFVGIKLPNYSAYQLFDEEIVIPVGEPWPIDVIVVSKNDDIVLDKAVNIKVFARGKEWPQSGQYSWHSIHECEAITAVGPASCQFIPSEENHYRVEAEILDSKGYPHKTTIQIEAVVDERRPVDKQDVTLRLQCLTDEVKVGDLVRCEVENHFGSSPVLVTIERAGVLDQWLKRLDEANPVIEFNVDESYGPRFQLSVLATAPQKTIASHKEASYRLATQQFRLEDPRLIPLTVAVSTTRAEYQPRDSVKLNIEIENNYGNSVPVEYAIAVVDDALLDLSQAGETYYDPTAKLWQIKENGVRTYGLINRLLQSQQYLLNADNSQTISASRSSIGSYLRMGGNPYEPPTNSRLRRVDKLIAYWNPSVIASGERTELDFVLPDNLTSWTVMVMAASADDRFGFDSTAFTSVKDTEIRAVSPNVVTEGDTFHVGASIYNRAPRKRTLLVEIQAGGLLSSTKATAYRKRLRFGPQERRVVTIPLVAGKLPVDLESLSKSWEIRLVASAGDRRDRDALEIRVPVRSSLVPVTSSVYGALTGDETSIPIEVPSTLAEQSGVLNFSLTTDERMQLDGVFQYVRDYPYSCWEQQLTQAIVAMHYLHLEELGVVHEVPWTAAEERIREVLSAALDYQAPNGGMAFFVPRDDTVRPYLSAYTAIAFSWLENAGYDVPVEVKQALLDYLREYLKSDLEEERGWAKKHDVKVLSRYRATIGALVLHALAISNTLTEVELGQYAKHLNEMDLFGLSQFLLAALKVDPTLPLNDQIVAKIMNHRFLVDGAVEYVEHVPLAFTRMLHSHTRSLCSLLSAFTELSELTENGIDIGELRELANSVRHARDNLPRWMSTQDNAFCTNAMLAYSEFVGASNAELLATVEFRSQESGTATLLADNWLLNSTTTTMQTRHPLQPEMVGARGSLDVTRQGNGVAFYNVELSYLSNATADNLNRYSGFEIHREYVVFRNHESHILKVGDPVTKGEIVLVNLYLSNKFDRNYVVIDDTVPGGLEPVNFELGTEARFITSQEIESILPSSKWYDDFQEAERGLFDRWDMLDLWFLWGFTHRELGLQNVLFFAEEIRRGRYHLQWFGQVITPGEFTVMPTHVEEMYRPVMFGKSEPWTFFVNP